MIDCVDKCDACEGGWPHHAFEYHKKKPMHSKSDYPYTGKDGTCKEGKSGWDDYVIVSEVHMVEAESAEALKKAISFGPVACAVDATTKYFFNYSRGIINTDKCGTAIDHAVTCVGYGVEDDQDYVIVKNTWGTSWGENGFVRIGLTDKKDKGYCGI